MPWHHDGSATSRPVNAGTGKAYRGSNILSLWIAAQAAGYTSGRWASYRQWQALGAQVRKGEQATTIVFWKINQRGEDADGGDDPQEGRGRTRMFARGYSVFNEAQVDGYAAPMIDLLSDDARLHNADAFWCNLGIATRHGGNEAYYVPSEDRVQMPEFAQFKDPAGYYGTLYHEGLHATGSSHRCDRDLAVVSVRTDMRRRRPSRTSAPHSSWLTLVSRTIPDRITPPTLPRGWRYGEVSISRVIARWR
jgi:antirestriction protein ArdC